MTSAAKFGMFGYEVACSTDFGYTGLRTQLISVTCLAGASLFLVTQKLEESLVVDAITSACVIRSARLDPVRGQKGGAALELLLMIHPPIDQFKSWTVSDFSWFNLR